LLYCIGTEREFPMLTGKFPDRVLTEVLRGVVILDAEYGENRDYKNEGGYSILIDSQDDLEQLRQIIDYNKYLCEWATIIGKDTGFLSALFIINDDFTILAYMPTAIAPDSILREVD